MGIRVNLKTARRIRKWRIGALASGALVNRCTITRLERGITVPELATRERLESLLGLPPGGLVFERNSKSHGNRQNANR